MSLPVAGVTVPGRLSCQDAGRRFEAVDTVRWR